MLSRMARTFEPGSANRSPLTALNPLAEVTTPSLEALKAYSTGLNLELSSGVAAAAPLLKRAVEIDPGFAVAHAHLGIAYSGLGESLLSMENTKHGLSIARSCQRP